MYLHTNGCCGHGLQAIVGGPQSNLAKMTEVRGRITTPHGCRLPGWCLDWSQPGKRVQSGIFCMCILDGTKYQNNCVCAPWGRETRQTQKKYQAKHEEYLTSMLDLKPTPRHACARNRDDTKKDDLLVPPLLVSWRVFVFPRVLSASRAAPLRPTPFTSQREHTSRVGTALEHN